VLQLVIINNAHVVIIIATINDNYYVFNKSLPSYVSSQVALPAFSAARHAVATSCCGAGRAAIEQYLLPTGPQQQTRRTLLQRANGTDRRTYRRTPNRYIDRALQFAVCIICGQCQ